jgi:hypothetical protein
MTPKPAHRRSSLCLRLLLRHPKQMRLGGLSLLAACLATGAACAADAFAVSPPVHLTSEQDHQRMMDLLHIKTLRGGVDGFNMQAPNAVNYDEANAGLTSPLPDPLTLNDGTRVTTPQMWWKKRRPEIVELFDREVLGRVPTQVPKVTWRVVSTTNETRGDVPVITKQLIGHVDNSAYPAVDVDIQLALTAPARAGKPVPVMMEFGFGAFPPGFKLPPAPPGPDWRDLLLARGWGYAVLQSTTIQADNGEGLTSGIIGLANKGQPRKLDDWGALRAWAWGASRVLDYFETDPAVDAKHIGIWGHSRFGKAALVAMAYDPRFAIAYISSSGEGGASLYRRNYGEMLENLAASGEYHWMAGNFLKYAGPLTVNDLPVDAHELIALCAPRPVFIGGGTVTAGDGWIDAQGMLMAAAAASPVYELLGAKGLGATEFPPLETALISGDIAFRQHRYGHWPGPNFPTFLDFASRYMRR